MLRLSELYTSVQGEGANVGLPTQFVRFAGCNLRCPGWPCDTPHAIEPSIWRHESEKLSGTDLIERIPSYPRNLCLTGGEPLTQPNIELQEFCELAWSKGHTIEMFTNGTQLLPHWAHGRMRFMMDWKLPGSGEYEKMPEDVRMANVRRLHMSDGVKFVAKDVEDLHIAHSDWHKLKAVGTVAQFWATPVWDALDPQSVVEYILDHELPWKLSVQVHKYVWDADKRLV